MDHNLREEALRRVKRKKAYVNQVISFFSTSAVLFFINIMTSSYLWCLWPIGFYAISIIFGGIRLIKDEALNTWEDDAVDREYRRLSGRRKPSDEYLDLEDLPRHEKSTTPKWDDRDMV